MVSKRIKHRTQTSKKRRFSGNRWTNLRGQLVEEQPKSSFSTLTTHQDGESVPESVPESEAANNDTASKNKVIDVEFSTKPETNINGNRIMDTDILSNVFLSLSCPDCGTSNLKL